MSAGFEETLKLKSEITEVPESDRLLKASAIIATEFDKTPAKTLIRARIRFIII